MIHQLKATRRGAISLAHIRNETWKLAFLHNLHDSFFFHVPREITKKSDDIRKSDRGLNTVVLCNVSISFSVFSFSFPLPESARKRLRICFNCHCLYGWCSHDITMTGYYFYYIKKLESYRWCVRNKSDWIIHKRVKFDAKYRAISIKRQYRIHIKSVT